MKEVKSYGILCCRKNKHLYEILFIKKRNSYAFIDFVKGEYKTNDDVRLLLSKMTVNEKSIILSLDFNLIWLYCCLKLDKKSIKFIRGETAFKKLDKTCLINNVKTTNHIELVYEIPKGHKNKKESILNAATREFYEETNISKEKYHIFLNIPPICYSFSDEGVKYTYIYYLALMNDFNYIPKVQFSNKHMIYEVSEIQFLPIDKIYLINKDKKLIKILKKVINLIKLHVIKN